MQRIKDLPKIERPREKLWRYGPNKLSNTDLLAILLRSGTTSEGVLKLSRRILRNFSLRELSTLDLKTLRELGLGMVGVSTIVACFELGQRALKDKNSVLILSEREVWQEMRDLRDKKKEYFVAFYLDVHKQLLKREVISIGSLSETLVHPREVFESAIKNNSAQIIVAHNHPSGKLEPSSADIKVTERLVAAGEILGIELLDHVIVTKSGYFSVKKSFC